MLATNYRYLTDDAQISTRPTLIFAISFTTASSGVGVVLYDASDANNGRKIIRLRELANRQVTVNFNPPLIARYGLYVELEGGVDTCTIQYANKIEE